MGEEFLAAEFVNHVGEAVGLFVEVGGVDLVDIAGEYDFGVVAGAGDDGFDFVRGEVLGFVDDEEDVGEAATANVSEGGYEDFFVFDHFVDGFGFFVFFVPLVFDEFEVVPEGLHVGVDFGFHVAGEVSDVFVGEGYDGACEVDLLVIASLFEGGCQGEEGLAGAGYAGDGDQGDGGVEQGVKGEGLFGVAGFDAVDGVFGYVFEVGGLAVVEGQGGVSARA